MKIYYVKRNDHKRSNVSLIVPYLGAYVDEKMANMAIALYWALVRHIDTDLFVESTDIKEYPVKKHAYYMDIYITGCQSDSLRSAILLSLLMDRHIASFHHLLLPGYHPW